MSFIGPPLPPGLSRDQGGEQDEQETIGPQRSSSFGPQLPPHLIKAQGGQEEDSNERVSSSTELEETGGSCYGPSLPSNLKKKRSSDDYDTAVATTSSPGYGPSLPPGFEIKQHYADEEDGGEKGRGVIGPSLPPGVGVAQDEGIRELQDEEEEEVIGPMPVVGGVSEAEDSYRRKKEFEYRARVMKDRLLGKDAPVAPQREEWMTELPPEIKPSGIGARKFRTTVTDLGDRSVWTDTPADRQRKAQEAAGTCEREKKKKKREIPDQVVAERDKQLAALAEEHNKKHRSESLLEMHTKKRKIEEQEKGKDQERRPFNRETDLDVRSSFVTPSKRKALMKDSRSALDSKFTHGSRSFL